MNLAMRYASSRPHWAFPPLTWAACASDARRRLSFDRLVPSFSPQARARPRVRSSRAARHWPRPAQSRSTEVYLAITKNKKAAPRRPLLRKIRKNLADHHRVRACHHHRLAGFDGMGGLAVVHIAAGCDAECRHCDTRHQRHDHDLQMGRTIG